LFESQKLEAIGKLAGGVAHDFNNLLSVVGGYLELAQGELSDKPTVLRWVQAARDSAERGANLTKMMLSFARRQPLQPMEIDPSILFRDFGEMLRRTLGEAIEIKLAAEPNQWHCEVDPGQLQSAVLNLAVNARDAMPNGGTLTIATCNVHLDAVAAGLIPGAAPGDYAVIVVSDTGFGMSSEVAERAFEPFFSTKDPARSSGLGLSMVSGFVAQSGGHVEIASEPGHGTTISIYLPRVHGVIVRTGDGATPATAARTRRATILIVEDNDEVQAVTKLQLERMGFAVLTAATGEGGLAQLHAHPDIDLLLSDLILPGGMDGVALAQQAATIWPRLKIVFMSGFSTHADLPVIGTLGVPRLLRKPFEKAQLDQAIHATLDER
jgi:CheY-like chemotaxis protein